MAGSSSPIFSISSSKASMASTVSSMRVTDFAGEIDVVWISGASSSARGASSSICECFGTSQAPS